LVTARLPLILVRRPQQDVSYK